MRAMPVPGTGPGRGTHPTNTALSIRRADAVTVSLKQALLAHFWPKMANNLCERAGSTRSRQHLARSGGVVGRLDLA